MRRLAAALAAFLLASAIPTAAAAPAHDVEGDLTMPGGVGLRGRLELQGSGLLEIERSGGEPAVAVSFAGLAHGELVDRTRDKVQTAMVPGQDEHSPTPPETDSTPVQADGPGRIEAVRCGRNCRVALIAAPGEGLLGLRGATDAVFVPTAAERVFSTAMSPQSPSKQLRHVVPAGSVQAEAAQFADPSPWASGRVVLVLVDAEADLVAGGTRRTLDARWSNETRMEAAGLPLVVRHHARYAALTLDAAALHLAPGEPFRLSFPAGADGRLDGALSAQDASGTLAIAGKRYRLDHDSLLLEGSLAARLGGTPPGLLGGTPSSEVGLQGETTRAVVSGANVVPWFPSTAAGAGGGLLALAGLAFLGRLLVVPLYHRLGPSDLLANANRRRIHDAIRARPGIDMAALVAAVGLSRILVRHHLRMLEAHRLVRATVWRRRRTYALAGAGPGTGLAACELKDSTRRRVAAAVAHGGGVTQKDLVRTLGLSQRLVSYHLKCLGDSSLVRAQGRPRVYVATPELAHALAREGTPARAPKSEALGHPLGKEGEGSAVAVATTA